MNFLVDAQLPRKLAVLLNGLGHDARHTIGLPYGNATPDGEICAVAAKEDRILITKDADFIDWHHLQGRPPKLLLVSTGNASTNDLLHLFENHISKIVSAFQEFAFIEITSTDLIVHN